MAFSMLIHAVLVSSAFSLVLEPLTLPVNATNAAYVPFTILLTEPFFRRIPPKQQQSVAKVLY